MRCKICSWTVKYAGRVARDRQICGMCWYTIKRILRERKIT